MAAGNSRRLPLAPVPLQHPLWERVVPFGHRRRLARGGVLYRQGETADACYYVLSGRIKAVMLRANGTEKILEVLGPGALLGEAAAFDGEPHFSSCIALEPTEVCALPVAAILRAMQADGEVALHIMRVMSRKQRVLAREVEEMAFFPVVVRVARLLLRLASDYGRGGGGWRDLALRLTHEQMASIVGASRIGVTRALSRLRRCACIEPLPGGTLRVHVPPLQRVAAGCAPEEAAAAGS